MVGDIYLANIYFTDASSAKVRPILLLQPNSFNDFLYIPLTTNLQVNGIHVNNSHLKEGFLPQVSVAVFEKPGVIAKTLLIKKIGKVNTSAYKSIISELVKFIEK